MHSLGVHPQPLIELAEKSAFALSNTDAWLHRRVERVSFTSQLMVRRQVSVDFTIPPRLPAFRAIEGATNEYFVPIALLRKWPPPMQFDFRAAQGEPISLLTSRKNQQIDSAALLGLAPDGPTKDVIEDDLRGVVCESPREARVHLERIGAALGERHRNGELDTDDLKKWVPAVRVATSLAANSLIWARVQGEELSRHVVKFSFEYPAPRNFHLHSRVLAALSWQPIRIQLELPTLGERGSQHLEVDLPPELEAQRVQFRVLPFPPQQPAVDGGRVKRAGVVIWHAVKGTSRAPFAATQVVLHGIWRKLLVLLGLPRSSFGERHPKHLIRPAAGDPYAWNSRDRAYFYIASSQHQYGLVTMHVAVANRTIINGALAMAVGTAALLTAFTLIRNRVIDADHIEPAVTTLLLVPVILGSLVVRPGEHPMVRRHLGAVRGLATVNGALPVIAAVALIGLGPDATGDDLLVWWRGLAIAAWTTAVLLGLSWLLPPARRERFVRPSEATPKKVPGGGLEVED